MRDRCAQCRIWNLKFRTLLQWQLMRLPLMPRNARLIISSLSTHNPPTPYHSTMSVLTKHWLLPQKRTTSLLHPASGALGSIASYIRNLLTILILIIIGQRVIQLCTVTTVYTSLLVLTVFPRMAYSLKKATILLPACIHGTRMSAHSTTAPMP